MKKNKKSRKIATVTIACVIIVLLVLLIIVTVQLRGQDNSASVDGESVENTGGDTSVNAEPDNSIVTDNEDVGADDGQLPEDDLNGDEEEQLGHVTIDTQYGGLQFSALWEKYLKTKIVDGDTYVVEFYGVIEDKEEQRLFDIYFGNGNGTLLGTIISEDGTETAVGIIYYFFDPDDSWDKEDSDIIYAMQEESNALIAQLPIIIKEEDAENISINTPYGVLKYPIKWEEAVRIEVVEDEPYAVEFYGKIVDKEEQHLFTVCFGGNDGDPVGTITDDNGESVIVYLIGYELDFGGDWTDSDKDIIYAMQEDANYLIEKLLLAY